jgi:outer membrane protein TolC
VRRAFFDLLAAQKIVGLRKEQVESARVFFSSSRERTVKGYASEFETVKSQADLVAAQKVLREAETKQVEARVSLNTLLVRQPAAQLDIVGSLENLTPRGSGDTFRALALAHNPSLRTKYLEAERACLKLRATRFGRRPVFAIGPAVEYLPDEQTYGLGVTVALPLWDQKKGEIQTATAEQERALAETQKAQIEIGSAVTKAIEKLEVGKKELALYAPDLLSNLKGFVDRAEKQYAQSKPRYSSTLMQKEPILTRWPIITAPLVTWRQYERSWKRRLACRSKRRIANEWCYERKGSRPLHVASFVPFCGSGSSVWLGWLPLTRESSQKRRILATGGQR